jgi:hypothetical protein
MRLSPTARLYIYGSIAGAILGLFVVFFHFMNYLAEESKGGVTFGRSTRLYRSPSDPRVVLKNVVLAQLAFEDKQGALKTIAMIPESADRDAILSEILEGVIGSQFMPDSEAQPFSKGKADVSPHMPLHPTQMKENIEIAEIIAEQIQDSNSKTNAWLAIAHASEAWGQKDTARQHLEKAIQEARNVRVKDNLDFEGSALKIPLTADEESSWKKIGGWAAFLWPVGLAFFGAILVPFLKAIIESFAKAFGNAIAQGLGSADLADYLSNRFRKSKSEAATPADAKVSVEGLPPTPS